MNLSKLMMIFVPPDICMHMFIYSVQIFTMYIILNASYVYITVEPLYNEGLKDWQNVFTLDFPWSVYYP